MLQPHLDADTSIFLKDAQEYLWYDYLQAVLLCAVTHADACACTNGVLADFKKAASDLSGYKKDDQKLDVSVAEGFTEFLPTRIYEDVKTL